MARQRDLTYAATLYVDVHQQWYRWENDQYVACTQNADGSPNPDIEEKVPLAKIPIMLGSKYCYLHGLSPKMRAEMGESEDDEGGYFIVNGTEKVVIAFERPRENTILVYPTKSSVTTHTDKVEVKSTIDQRFFPIHETSAYLVNKKDSGRVGQNNKNINQLISVKIRYVRNDIPLFVAFRALGIISDKAIMELILYDVDLENMSQADQNIANLLLPSAEEANSLKDLGDPSILLTIRSQEDALRYIAHPKNINYKVDFISNPEEQRKARLIFAKNILDKEFLPHMNPPNGEPNNRKKAIYLGHMIRRLLECHLGMQPYNDRDHYDFKRVNTTGALLAKIFSPNLKRLNSKIRTNIQKQSSCEPNRGLRKDIQSCTIETALKFALSTGNWATSKSGSTSSSDKGVAQVLQRMTPYSALSHLRRVMSPLDSTGSKLVPPRKLHATQIGHICPNETPEGDQVGIVKNLALSVNITIPTSTAPIYACLNDLGIRLLEEIWIGELKNAIKVFVNGHFYGILKQEIVAAVYQELKLLKRDGTFDIHTSISWNIDLKELHVLTDGGRYCRPFYIVEENKDTGLFEPLIARKWKNIGKDLVQQKTKWHSLVTGTGLESSYCKGNKPIKKGINVIEYGKENILAKEATMGSFDERMMKGGVIEYLDTTEISMAMIAIDSYSLSEKVNGKSNKEWYRYNYLEIHPICMLGVISQMTPFSDHNPSPRNCYQSSMGKQALGIHTTNYNSRYDTNSYILLNIQRPLVNPRTMELVGFDKLPTGQQIIVAIMNFTGYNQEDSIMLNGAGLDRGRFNTLASKTHKDKEAKKAANAIRGKTNLGGQEQFMKPDREKTKDMRMGSYAFLDESGLAKVGSELEGGDIIIGKTIELSPEEQKKSRNGEIYKDISKDIKKNEYGTVDKVLNGKTHDLTNSDLETIAKIRVVHRRKPIIGDKFACLTDDHEVCCENGWKSIADVTITDKVATLNPKTNTMSYEHPSATMVYNYSGDMYEVKSDQIDLFVTPTHKMYVKYEDVRGSDDYKLIEAKDLVGKRVRYKKDAIFEGGESLKCVERVEHLIGKRISKKSINKAKELLAALNLNHEDKYYYSKEWVDDIQILCLHAGYTAKIKAVQSSKVIRDLYSIVLSETKSRPEVNDINIVKDFNGQVYCITVPTGIFCVRRNGLSVWTGNSRSAQKGTCGMIYVQGDLPFTSQGLIPDLIMNPHAIPSRMTIGQIIESQASKLAAMTGEYVDGTSFIEYDREGTEKQLTSYGLNSKCDEIMYNPQTGEQMNNAIFITPTYYQRLKHMVDDKMHARDRGPVTLLTRQPQEGRSRDGGLRLGEMERDAIIAHSMPFFLKERLVDFSDIFRVYVSKKYKAIVMANPDREFYMYNNEMLSKNEVTEVQMPYAFKLLLHEIASMGVDIALCV